MREEGYSREKIWAMRQSPRSWMIPRRPLDLEQLCIAVQIRAKKMGLPISLLMSKGMWLRPESGWGVILGVMVLLVEDSLRGETQL